MDRGDNLFEMGTNLSLVDLGPGAVVQSFDVGSAHACALLTNGSIKCWGANDEGQLGLGDQDARGDNLYEMGANLTLVDLGPGAVVQRVDLGATHACALLTTGAVKCWGANDVGQLGLGDIAYRGDESGEMGASLPSVALF
jgi:alpha-tubulin suppressor-like RCC1 family protein